MQKNWKHPFWSDEARRQREIDRRKRGPGVYVPIILGSSSKWRRKVLEDAKIECTPLSADIDEKSIRHPDPAVMTLNIATAKAGALLPRIWAEVMPPPAGLPFLLVTADQVAVCRGAVLEKPRDAGEARAWLRDFGNHRMVSTVTTVVVTDIVSKRARHATHEATVVFRPMPHEAIDRAIARGDVLGACGAFTVDDQDLAPYVTLPGVKQDPDERSSVEGLPLGRTIELLKTFGWREPD